jgi:ABC-type uncharacterized transport system ATPase subunit
MAFLDLIELRKCFGGVVAVDGFSLALEAGALHALVGPNGCGKSTLFNLITGMFAPDSGRIRVGGQDIAGWPAHRIARLGVGRKFQVPAVFPELSVAENLAVPGLARGRVGHWHPAPEGERALLERIRLDGQRTRLAGELSHGERQWLEIGMLLALKPRLLLLDEPTAGMTAAETAETARLIRDIAVDGQATILVIEHDVGFIERLDCPLTVMAKGRVLRTGTFASIRADAEVRALYFGRSGHA